MTICHGACHVHWIARHAIESTQSHNVCPSYVMCCVLYVFMGVIDSIVYRILLSPASVIEWFVS